jgi:hypothetical protein
MKKVLLTISALAMFAGGAMAQKMALPFKQYKDMGVTNPERLKNTTTNLDNPVGWYSWLELASKSNVGSGLQTFVAFINNDSLFKDINADGSIDYTFWFGGGGVLDPKDDLLQLTDNPEYQLSKFNSYRLDSIAFTYLYVRNVDSIDDGNGNMAPVVDTLRIAYYAGNKLRRLSFEQSQNRLALPVQDWNRQLRIPGPNSYNAMETFLLNSAVNGIADTTRVSNNAGGFENGWFSKIATFKAPTGIQINASPAGTTLNNLVGFSFHFGTGIPAVLNGDTAVFIYGKDPVAEPFTGRRANYFGMRYAVAAEGTKWDNKTFYNTSLLFPRWAAYQPNNGWDGFVSGNAFIRDFFTDVYYHLSVIGNIGVGMEEPGVSIAGIYPNPAKGKALVRFNTKSTAPTSATVVNLVGQVVKNIDFGVATAGNNEFNLDLTSLKAGVYFVNITNGKVSATERLVVTE